MFIFNLYVAAYLYSLKWWFDEELINKNKLNVFNYDSLDK